MTKLFTDPSITIAHNDLSHQKGLTLFAIMHNEMYFLPSFLEHYRRLGVERFILLDDASDDGSFEFATEQKDVMLVRSAHRYGDLIMNTHKGVKKRAMLAWRNTVPELFCKNIWSLQVDVDEFLEIPKGQNLQDLIMSCTGPRNNVIWSVMIDLYPATWGEILKEPKPEIHDLEWYFDALPHLRWRRTKPRQIYSGTRVRLKSTFDIGMEKERFFSKLKRLITTNNPYPVMGNLRKPAVIKWQEGMAFSSSHYVYPARAASMILPLCHYKFSPNLKDRIEGAMKNKGHYKNGRGYSELNLLYQKMTEENAGFLFENSKRYVDFDSFQNPPLALNLPKSR